MDAQREIRIEQLQVLGFNDEEDYAEYLRCLARGKALGRSQVLLVADGDFCTLPNSLNTHEIRVNGERVAKSDEYSLLVVFDSLTRRNPSCRSISQGDYLVRMEKEWNVSLSGAHIELAEIGGASIDSLRFA